MSATEPLCPSCGHTHPDYDCDCGCEYDAAFCGVCGWLDCECPKFGDGDRVRIWLGSPKMGGWHHGKVVGIDNLGHTGVQIKFDYPVKGEWFCYATHDEVERVISPACTCGHGDDAGIEGCDHDRDCPRWDGTYAPGPHDGDPITPPAPSTPEEAL